MQDINIEQRNEKLGFEVVKNLKKRNFESYYYKTKDETIKQIIDLIPKNATVSWGGSVSLDELGIKEYLKNNNYKTIDRDEAQSQEQREEFILKSLRSDVFLMSANAISTDGEIVNIDGLGNRISALCYGPKKIIMVVGMNKVVKTLDDALSRAKNHAAPINAQRVSKFSQIKTPCLSGGFCYDCKSETSICSQILITRLSKPKNRICVILVNDNLGYWL